MRVAILNNPGGLSAYYGEIFQAWGLPIFDLVAPGALESLDASETPLLIIPAQRNGETAAQSLLDYTERGGTLITFLPKNEIARAAGLEFKIEKETPLRFRVTQYPVAGLAGELLPIVGRAAEYELSDASQILGFLSFPGSYQGESVGAAVTEKGQGRIVSVFFDLALCVLMLRQGDPERAEFVPEGDGCARPSHMAADIGPNDTAWIPYADLLGRWLVDLVRRYLDAPVPLLSNLPGEAPGILLYSGDEDHAEVAWNDEQLNWIAGAGGRMNLYIIPNWTRSTLEDSQRYLERHDLGPHPNLRPLDGEPVSKRLEEFERQIKMFNEVFEQKARTLRNHCTAWAGYLEPVEIMERNGIEMDGNYFSGTYMRDREGAPYAGFGSALPMRFIHPDGQLYKVFQQHTHITDDVLFGNADYSFKLSPEQFEAILDRIYDDITNRFHTPFAVCIHPSNWAKFSSQQGRALLLRAGERGMPVWSFDQWLDFLKARDSWRFEKLEWNGHTLEILLEGESAHDGLRVLIPASHGRLQIKQLVSLGTVVPAQRHKQNVVLAAVPPGETRLSLTVEYEPC